MIFLTFCLLCGMHAFVTAAAISVKPELKKTGDVHTQDMGEKNRNRTKEDWLRAYSNGEIRSREAMYRADLDTFWDLMEAMAEHGFDLPGDKGREAEIEKQVERSRPHFERIFGTEMSP